MNKKKLPKAIRPGAARSGMGAAALGATAAAGSGSYVEGVTMTPDEIVADRRAVAEKVIERFAIYAGAAGIIPIPFVDLATVGGVQIQMLRRLSQIYDLPFSENRGKTLIAALAGAVIPATSAAGAFSLVKSVPLFGMLTGAIAMPALSAGATYAIGMAFIEHFASGRTLLDFNPPDYREFINKQKALWRKRGSGKEAQSA
jgi:uncharacterized protein (DUF697 family)